MKRINAGGILQGLFVLLFFHCSLPAEETVDFGRKIRPILAEKCFACHGPDAEKREGELRLDTQQGLFGKGDSGETTVTPNRLDQSSIYQRIILASGDEKMPPPNSDKLLTADEIQQIKLWIEQGAKWQQHWSLVAPVRPAVPAADGQTWPRNEIDRFISQRHKKEGLRPQDEADKFALLRRVNYDLTGLPPTPAEILSFMADRTPEAYEHVVDRLLKSPHYGEHMARFWLDAARYGDTHGLHLDNYRVMWPYRDWVVRAFNANMPFDQFTIEQLAGDLLPNASQEQLIATGFNRCNVTTSEGGALSEEYEVYYTNDRVATMSTVWMATSMGCVTCHDNKFDPYEMKDFYQLYAFFNNLDGPVMDGNARDTAPSMLIMNDSQRAELARMDKRLAELSQITAAPNAEMDQSQLDWEIAYKEMMREPAEWTVLVPERYDSARSASFEKLEDNSLLVGGTNANQDVYEISGSVAGNAITAVRLEGLVHPSLSQGGAGRSPNSNVVLTEIELEFAPISTSQSPLWQPAKLSRAWADYEQADGNYKIANAIDGKPETGWAIAGHQRRENRLAIFGLEKPIECGEGALLRVRLRHESIYAQHQFGRIRLATTTARKIPQFESAQVPAEIVKVLDIDVSKRDDKQRTQLRDYYRANITGDAVMRQAFKDSAAAKKQKSEFESALPLSLIWRDAAKSKAAHILLRGAYDKKGAEVVRNTPAALPPMVSVARGATPTRLDLANWLLSANHPLTARVIVNRYWQQFFGTGIVETSEDFGSQGSQPQFPELLDWLAVDFRESGWNVKRIHKMMLMSATYRQSATAAPGSREADPQNRLLARGPRFRMDGETIRDTALAASGLMVKTVGGPSVKPYQPEGIWEAVGYTDSNTAKFSRDSGDALYRRSLYTFWKRTAPPPAMVNFDAPSRETCSVRRSRTNTPLAALVLMNDEQFVEASKALARRVILEGGEEDGLRMDYAFLLTVGRPPTSAETAVVGEVLNDAKHRYQQDLEAAGKLISVGESKADPKLNPAEQAAWTMVANLLLNLDETITK